MQDVQEIFNRMQAIKKQQKDIKSAFNEALKQNSELAEIVEKIKALQVKKKQIEMSVKQDFSSEFTKLDDLKIDINSDQELLTDASVTKLMKGETVEVKDEYDQTYQPVFSVKFKKT